MINFKKYLTPKLFTGLAIVGVGTTVYFAVKETKAVEKEKEHVEESGQPEVGVEEENGDTTLKQNISRVVETAFRYKGTIITSSLTVSFILASHKLSAKEIAALTATCGYLASNRDKLESEIKKLPGGEEALKAVKKEVVATRTKDILDEENGHKKGDFWRHQSVEWTGNGDLLCYDHFTGRYFRSNEDAVREGISMWNDDREYEFNDRTGDIRYEYDDESDINDLYSYLNLERSQLNSMYHFPQQRRIKINLTRIPVERLDPVTMARYNEDLLIMEYDDKSMPIDKARKLTASDIYSL